MDYFPVFLNLRRRQVIVVGGGQIASRKAELIGKSGARMTIIAPTLSPAMRALIIRFGYQHLPQAWEGDQSDPLLNDAHVVIAATDEPEVNASVHRCAVARHIPVNVVDEPSLCTFIMPAIVDRSPIVIAMSSGGRSPVLLRQMRTRLERLLPTGLGRLAGFLGRFRDTVATALPDFTARRRFWEDLLASTVPDLVYAGRDREASRELMLSISDYQGDAIQKGAVYLIGAGPGDPELLTLKGQRLLQRADVVIYDRLVPVGVLEMCRREAELIYVGKKQGDHPVPQEEIGAMLVRLAREGNRVARLKGGDPFVFGRGGEELSELVRADVDFEVVPGISAANGAASYAGIPLTHRDHAQSVSFWTGHKRNDRLDLDWSSMVTAGQTLVFFMARPNARLITDQLVQHGLAPTTPVAVVSAATTPKQKVVRTSLHRLPDAAAATDPELPVLLIIGTVVNLREDIVWFADEMDQTAAVFPRHLKVADSTAGSSVA
ncbi:MAG: siroheme synthase CysG [Pseudomonadota bacterium]